ncbi:GvpL/GvpF family gas vesicle protein [Pimelobacter simplex]|uniref:GvpL/GvpF family gas vesicle protein n=1 Tax=Nocardioides simplex TaxID=2045 RepID=UPI0019327859|nr:GvpL/GvpF family gas vesicle protein [Pimelobacter simplex]
MGSGAASRESAPEGASDHGALLVFGVVPAPDDGPPVILNDSSAMAVAHSGVAAVVAPVRLDRPAGRAELKQYQAVLDDVVAQTAVVPVRFGTVLEDEEAVLEFLARQHDQLGLALDRLRGHRQYNLRVTYREEEVLAQLVAGEPEIEALRNRTKDLPEDASYADRIRLGELIARALEARAADDARPLLDTIAPLAADLRVRQQPGGLQVLDVALLVEDQRAEQMLDALEALASENRDLLVFRAVGPLPAYDFVEDAAWA